MKHKRSCEINGLWWTTVTAVVLRVESKRSLPSCKSNGKKKYQLLFIILSYSDLVYSVVLYSVRKIQRIRLRTVELEKIVRGKPLTATKNQFDPLFFSFFSSSTINLSRRPGTTISTVCSRYHDIRVTCRSQPVH